MYELALSRLSPCVAIEDEELSESGDGIVQAFVRSEARTPVNSPATELGPVVHQRLTNVARVLPDTEGGA